MNLLRTAGKNYLFIQLILLVFFISLLFRVTNLDLIEFKADEGINLFLATRPLFGHSFVPGGTVSSLGITNLPLINYILLPLTIISTDPKIISFFIGFLNSLAIVAFFIIVRRYYNQTTALASSLLIATSPWAILFSRKIWAQDFLFPLFIPLFLSIHKIIIDKNQKYWLLFSFSSLLLVQIHQSVIFFLAPLILFMIIYRVKINFKYLIYGVVAGLIPTLHYIYYQLSTGCFDCKMFLSSGQRVSDQASLALFIRPLQLLNQGNFFGILREDVIYFATEFPLAYLAKQIYFIEYILLLIGMVLFFRNFKKMGFIIFPVIILPFIYAFFKLEPHIHYFLIIAPFLFLFLGVSLNFFLSSKKKFLIFLSGTVFILLISVSLYYNFAFYSTVRHQKNIKGDYGLIFSETEKNTKREYRQFLSDPYYNEMIISSYIPYSLTHGDIGISRMLYDPGQTEQNMSRLEERLMEVPLDRRVHQELIAYYTKRTPSKKTVEYLLKKSIVNPGLKPVYDEVLNYYNEKAKK